MTRDIRDNLIEAPYTRAELRERARLHGGEPCAACGDFIDGDAGFCDCTPDVAATLTDGTK